MLPGFLYFLACHVALLLVECHEVSSGSVVGLRVKMCVWLGVSRGLDLGLRVKMCVWLGVSRGLDLAFLNAD